MRPAGLKILTYERLGEEALDDLQTLCRTCHWLIHRPYEEPKREPSAKKHGQPSPLDKFSQRAERDRQTRAGTSGRALTE